MNASNTVEIDAFSVVMMDRAQAAGHRAFIPIQIAKERHRRAVRGFAGPETPMGIVRLGGKSPL